MMDARYTTFDGMTWPRVGTNLEWTLRYGTPTREDLLLAASVAAAYEALVEASAATRGDVVKHLRADRLATLKKGTL